MEQYWDLPLRHRQHHDFDQRFSGIRRDPHCRASWRMGTGNLPIHLVHLRKLTRITHPDSGVHNIGERQAMLPQLLRDRLERLLRLCANVASGAPTGFPYPATRLACGVDEGCE